MPEHRDDETMEEARNRLKWKNDDYIYRGHILNGMSDSLFDVYQNYESAKELWNELESKFMAEDASSKKFLVGNFMNCKMTDSRPVMEQYNELLWILGQFSQHKMEMDESISVSSIIDKLPPFWKDFKHMLKHKKEELSIVQLEGHLRIEESLRAQEGTKGKNKEIMEQSSINMMEVGESSKGFKGKKRPMSNTNDDTNKKPKGACWICGKTGHFKNDCRLKKTKKGSNYKNKSGQDDEIAWWIDSGATKHVCKDRRWFKTYEPVNDGSILYMSNESTTPILGRGVVVLIFSSGKSVHLYDVLHVPGIRKNLVSGGLLSKYGYRQVFESDKYVISKCGYAMHCKAYRFYVIESNRSIAVNTVIESRDTIFDENRFSSLPRPKDIVSLNNGTNEENINFEPQDESPEIRRGTRIRKRKSFGPGFQTYLVEGSREEVGCQYEYCYHVDEDPKTFGEAMKSQDVAFWKKAINDEMDSIMGNNTWVLTDLPHGCKPLGCKWIFKRKMKVDGSIDKYKARLVIQGFRQKEGIDYFDTYAPVARISTTPVVPDQR
ncbi:uncharacterized protein LOC141607327 [Silene latifolia]|uniref:uncharacterized protein LOC141607327 n=1 Tax=Silene latifolia TaxID=37657 RepID=UPI003D7877AC